MRPARRHHCAAPVPHLSHYLTQSTNFDSAILVYTLGGGEGGDGEGRVRPSPEPPAAAPWRLARPQSPGSPPGLGPSARTESNLVDSASSHTLVSKIKPCMSKYKQLYTVKLRMAHYISYSLFDSTLLLG